MARVSSFLGGDNPSLLFAGFSSSAKRLNPVLFFACFTATQHVSWFPDPTILQSILQATATATATATAHSSTAREAQSDGSGNGGHWQMLRDVARCCEMLRCTDRKMNLDEHRWTTIESYRIGHEIFESYNCAWLCMKFGEESRSNLLDALDGQEFSTRSQVGRTIQRKLLACRALAKMHSLLGDSSLWRCVCDRSCAFDAFVRWRLSCCKYFPGAFKIDWME